MPTVYQVSGRQTRPSSLYLCRKIQGVKMNNSSIGKRYFENFDSLRFISFLSIFHFHTFFSDEFPDNISYSFLHKVFKNGDLGVNFFFTLSGFLITYHLLMEEKQYGMFSLKKFYIRRVLRIWPLYYVTFLFGHTK